MIGLKVYADKLEPYIHWDVDYFEVYIRHIDYLGKPVDLQTQLNQLAKIKDKVWGIHGGILFQGVNFCDPAASDDNRKGLDIVFDALPHFKNCQYIVFHPGCFTNPLTCSLKELISWIKPIDDPRFMIEIEPSLAYKERYMLPLYKVKDWLALKQKINKDIVVDTGHAAISARVAGLDEHDYINHLIETLNPKVIHLANNDLRGDGFEDAHLPLSKGVLKFDKLKNNLENKLLTIEVGDLSMNDVELIRSLNLSRNKFVFHD